MVLMEGLCFSFPLFWITLDLTSLLSDYSYGSIGLLNSQVALGMETMKMERRGKIMIGKERGKRGQYLLYSHEP